MSSISKEKRMNAIMSYLKMLTGQREGQEISFLGNYALGKMRKGAQKKSEDESEKSSI